MKRRELLRLLGSAATAAAAPLFPGLNSHEQERVVDILGNRHRIDAPVIGHIESVLWSAMRQDDAIGPHAALDTVLAQRHLVRAVLPDCPPDLKPRLLSLFSNLSRFAGWLSFDLSDFDSASYFYEQARSAAHEAENTDLGIFVLCNMSHLATWRGQPRVGIDHAVAAQGWARQTDDALLGAYAADVAARAYATAGMQRQCYEALHSIPDGLDTTSHTPATSLVYFYGHGQYAYTRAQACCCCMTPGALSKPRRKRWPASAPRSPATRRSAPCTWATPTSTPAKSPKPPASLAMGPNWRPATSRPVWCQCFSVRVTGLATGDQSGPSAR